MEQVRLGIIGCGIAAGELHLPALYNLQDKFKIAAVCNHTKHKAEEFSRLAGNVPYFLDYREMLNKSGIDAVDIALPISLNRQVVSDALKAGRHVIVEKPLAGNLRDAKAMLALEKKYKTVKMVAENFIYRATLHKVKELIRRGLIGSPYAVTWNSCHFVDPKTNKYAHTGWRAKPKHSGGFVTDGGIHFMAGLRLMFGKITPTACFIKNVNKELASPDTFSMQFKAPRGIDGIFNIFFSVKGFYEHKLTVFGTEGTLFVEGNKITIKKTDEPDFVEEVVDDGGFIAEFENFYNAINKKEKAVSTFTEAYECLKILFDAMEKA